MEWLPDSLLGQIFSVAGRRAGAAITRVCHRWHRVFFSEPALWRTLALTADSLEAANAKRKAGRWFSSKAALLRRVGGLVQRLRYAEVQQDGGDPDDDDEFVDMRWVADDSLSTWRLSTSVLAHLSASALQSLHLEWQAADAAAMKALGRFTGLTELSVACHGRMEACVATGLRGLPQLRRLELRAGSLPNGLPAALRHLTQLTFLSCNSRGDLPDLAAVLALSQLRQLAWTEERCNSMRRPDMQRILAQLPHLESWALGSVDLLLDHGSLQVGDAVLQSCRIVQCDRASGDVKAVELFDVQELSSNEGSLQQLLAGLLPTGGPPIRLRSLSISRSHLPPLSGVDCGYLEHLTSLELSMCSFPNAGAGQDAGSGTGIMLQQVGPQLRRLTLVGCFNLQQGRLPAALVNRTGLQDLCLKANNLADLPPGPYLSSLTSLDLSRNSFMKLPQALSAATGLQELSLHGNSNLALTTGCVKSVLLRLPHLQQLCLGVTRTDAHELWQLFRRAPRLKIAQGSMAF